MDRKIREDPMLSVKKAEKNALDSILNNPWKIQKLRKLGVSAALSLAELS